LEVTKISIPQQRSASQCRGFSVYKGEGVQSPSRAVRGKQAKKRREWRYKPRNPSRLYCTMSAANSEATSDITVIIVFSEGPAVSLNGSPTVSPITAALCASEPFPP